MTRKDYVAIAIETAGSALAFVAGAIADCMAADNPRFDRARFLKACGVQS